ncbi:MAG: hypothetical protein ACXWC8_18265, partial [Limisphaerales bacterium]
SSSVILTTKNDSAAVLPGALSVSSNGQLVVFSSGDGSLVANDTNNCLDIFVAQLDRSKRSLISTSASGGFDTNGPAVAPAQSADGRYVAFRRSTVFGNTSGGDVYYRDLQSVQSYGSSLITTNYAGVALGTAVGHALSADGRYVAYQTASAVVPSDTNSKNDIYCVDTVSGSTTLISYPGAGFSTAYDSSNAVFSADGRWLVFQSPSPYMSGVAFGTTAVQLYARNMLSNSCALVSYGPGGALFSGNNSNAVFSANGQVMAFCSSSSGTPLIAIHNFSNNVNQTVCYNGFWPTLNGDGSKIAYVVRRTGGDQIYIQNVGSTLSNLVSVATNGISPANGNCSNPILTPSGRFVIFTSTAANLVAGDTNGLSDIFVRDLALQITFALAASTTTTSAFGAQGPVVSGDGHTIVFQSFSTDLTGGDLSTYRKIFAVRLLNTDSDHDGMDDDWEMTYFGDLSHDGSADTDGDGMTDLQEFLAGTNPTNNDSVLRCLAVTSSQGGATIYWSAVPGRTYRVEYKTSVDDPIWTTLIDSTTAIISTASAIDPDPSLNSQRFYRVTSLAQ